jgi:hypothetical protein
MLLSTDVTGASCVVTGPARTVPAGLLKPEVRTMSDKSRTASLLAMLSMAAGVVASMQAGAHHSYAIFDFGKEVTLSGAVKELQWNNPHCFIQLLVAGPAGTEEWSIEMGSPMLVTRRGWKPTLIKAGDKITVVIHPLRDGSHGGDYVRASGADGQALGH